MLLEITHSTLYQYSPDVEIAQHIAHLKPHTTNNQVVLNSNLTIEPKPDWYSETEDVFGNICSFFSIQNKHQQLNITSQSLIETNNPGILTAQLENSPPWEEVREYFRYHAQSNWNPAVEFSFPSPYVTQHPEFSEFTRSIFTVKRPTLEAAIDLMKQIHFKMRYTSESTEIDTPAFEALRRREGVCQDFSHIFLSCIRNLGLAGKYVSGYLLTDPPEGQPRLIGADASHAWASLYVPNMDQNGELSEGKWYDFDPTNNRWGWGSPGEDYVSLAYGRDYSDISPIRGVIQGGTEHTLDVAVTVKPA